jgi:hypothetical protein
LRAKIECPDRDERVIRGAGGSRDAFFRMVDATLRETYRPD